MNVIDISTDLIENFESVESASEIKGTKDLRIDLTLP